MAWAGLERLSLGLHDAPPPSAEPVEGEWIDLRPRWPLTCERHPLCPTIGKSRRRQPPKPSKQDFTSLTDLTRAQLQQQQQHPMDAA